MLGNPGNAVCYYFNTDNRKELSFYYNGDYQEREVARLRALVESLVTARHER